MKFQVKALAAALALLAAAGQASAAIQPTSVPGSSEIFFLAYGTDTVSGKKATFIQDLGVVATDFLANPTFSKLSFANDANWLAFTGANLSNMQWGIYGEMRVSGTPTAPDTYQMLTTAAGDNWAGATTKSNANFVSANANMANTLLWINLGETDYGTNKSYYRDITVTNEGNAGQKYGSNWGTPGWLNTTNPFSDSTAGFGWLSRGAGTNAAGKPTYTDAANGKYWVFDGSSVALVPEPESYAMLLAGLGLVGAMVRRRSAGLF